MIRRPPRSTRTDTLFPYTTLCRSTLLGVGTELSIGDDESDLVRAIRQSSQQSASQAGQQIVSKNLNLQPTITVRPGWPLRSEEHTSELKSLMRISYAVFCLKKQTYSRNQHNQ